MKVMNSRIEIGSLVFSNRVNSVAVQSSRKNITGTATIKLPNLRRQTDQQKIEKIIRVGDAVKIMLGYDDRLVSEFEGYVSIISPQIPLEIICEDEMWKLKQETVSMSWRSTTLKEVLRFLVPTATINCPDITMAPFRLNKVTKAKALEQIKDEYILDIYFRGKTLFAGLAYTETGLGEVNYHFQKNALMGNLQYRRKEDVKIKVKAIGMQPDNTKIEVEVGDTDGETHTLHFYNKTKEDLNALAEQKIKLMRYDGYRGSFTGFGQPYASHGMVANLMDDRYPERAGRYLIDGTGVKYDQSGYRREVSLGLKAEG